VNDTAWEVISIARQCAKEDIADKFGGVSFAFLLFIILVDGKGKRGYISKKPNFDIQSL